MTRSSDILFMAEYIKNVLYFATTRQGKVLKSTVDTHYFSIDDVLTYDNYYSDFGPLNLGCVYKYCKLLNEKLKLYFNKQVIVHYTSTEPNKKANAAFVLGCYGVLYMNLSPGDALKPLLAHGQSYRSFQDATQGESQFTISLIDCLQAIKKARDLGFFNIEDFNYQEYDRLDKIQGGDLNWIVPGKFLAFIGPVDGTISFYHPPEMYIDYFLENDVKIVIRLNKKFYNGNVFSNAGILHYDLFFPDGSCPPRNILLKFLQISEDSEGALAVHCKAGLGRTGSLIGCYIIKHYRMTAHEAIGWMRICRPGSVIGHQQEWLEHLEPWLKKQGNLYRKRTYGDDNRFPIHRFGVYSIAEKALRHRPVVFHKSPSPPHIQRQTRSDISPPIRAQSSKPREAFNKTLEKEASDRRMRDQKTNVRHYNYISDQKDTNSIHHRGTAAGGGDPRLISGSRGSISRNSQHSAKSNDSRTRYTSGYQTQIPTFRTSQGPVIKTINDAKNILLQNTIRREDRGTLLNSNMKVTPHYSRVSQYASGSGRLVINNSGHLTPTYNSASRNAVQNSAPRRRLGRSPSPPQPRIVEQSRATNTPLTYSGKFLAEDASKTVLKAELSRLKVVAARNGSIGTASVGAASLGARRDAPTPKRAPSVHSDERSLATQGDLLNSIKFQRRYLNSFISEKLSGLVQDKISTTSKERISIKDGNSGIRGNHQYYDASATPKDRISTKDGNTGNRGHNQYYDVSANSKDRISIKDGSTGTVNRGSNQCYDVSDARERTRTTTTSRSGFGPQRPSSPKARRNSQMYY